MIDFDFLSNKAITLQKNERHDESLVYYGKALAIRPDDDVMWSDKAISLFYLNRYDEAFACYDESLRLKLEEPEKKSSKLRHKIQENFSEMVFFVEKPMSLWN